MNLKIKYALFTGVYFVGLLLVAEIFTRILMSKIQRYDIEMTRYSLELKAEKKDSDVGYLHKPSSKAHLMGVDVEINSKGLRSKEFTELPEPNTHRILFLGDSLTFGWGVKEEETFARRLETSLSKEQAVEIINAGHGNYNSTQEANYFFKYAQNWKPNQVVLFYFINDAEEMQLSTKWDFLSHSRLVSLFWSAYRSSGLGGAGKGQSFVDYYANLYKNSGWEKSKESIKKLASYCAETGLTFQVVILPELHQLNPYLFEKEHELISRFLTDNKISHKDLTEEFKSVGIKNTRELWVSEDDAHPNGKAQEMIAKFTKDFIKAGIKNEAQ